MSYPPVRYTGDGGDRSAVVRPAAERPEITYPNGTTTQYLATGATTAGQFGLYRWNMGPEPGGPGAHFHRTISESFFVLSGTVRLYDGTEWREGREGDFFFVPEGGIHGFRNESGLPASMLILFVPGAPREDYFETLAEVAGGRKMSDEEWAAFFDRHDTYWV